MNLFPVATAPLAAARALDDSRRARVREHAAQALANVLWRADPTLAATVTGLPALRSEVHPWSRWTAQTGANFVWVALYGLELAWNHSSRPTLQALYDFSTRYWSFETARRLTPFPNEARDPRRSLDFTQEGSVVNCYRTYLSALWRLDAKPPTWRSGQRPGWFTG